MKVREITANSFWKGEVCVSGLVEDGAETCEAKIYLKSSQVFDYSCSCDEGNSYRGMCRHCKCLLDEFQKKGVERSSASVSTSPAVRTMIREYTKRDVARIAGEYEGESVSLLPFLVIRPEGVGLECRIGRERIYVVKNLIAFSLAVTQGLYEEYGKSGKGLRFQHSLYAFSEASRPLVRLVLDLAETYQLPLEQLKPRGALSYPALRMLYLDKRSCDRLFEMYQGETVEAEDPAGQLRSLFVCGGNPLFEVTVRRAGKDGLSVTVPEDLMIFSGEEHLYVADRNCLYRCDEDYTEGLTVFLEQMTGRRENRGGILINNRDVPLFLERVLKKLEHLGLVNEEAGIEEYRPEPLTAVFSFDSGGPDQIVMQPELSYGSFHFFPLKDEAVPHSVCRDVPGEFRISQLILKYFEYREDETERLMIREDPDALYRLLDEGIEEFRAAGDVFFSEAFRGIRVLPPPRISVGVSMTESWLELTVDVGGMSGAELSRVLSEYGKKKKYYRMKNGEFLKLQDDGLLTVAKLVDGLSITREELKSKKLHFPGYRALYLDSLFKEDSGIPFDRDQSFRSLIKGMKAVEDNSFDIPREVKGTLREYQKTGFRWLKTLDMYGFGGILADDMGLGKTLQMLCVLSDYYGADGGEQKRLPSLVICPASLVYNWKYEFETFAPGLRVSAVVGALKERTALISESGSQDVLITSYDLLKRDLTAYGGIEFRYEILDEAQFIKNAATQSARAVKSIRARSRFALTGTPVENRLGELWSIFDYLMPGFLFSYRRFKNRFELPIVRDNDSQALESLRRMIGPFVLRRLKKDVLKELPEKLERTVYSVLEGKQKALYLATALKLKALLEQDGGTESPQERFRILAELTRLRQLCCDPALCCEGYDGKSAKLETCVDLITGAVEAGHKILVFSQFSSMLEILRNRLRREETACYLLTGSTPKEERSRLVQTFQKDGVPVFLISLKAGGTGLNLTAADLVIHYDPWWNVAVQNQATDRTHRIGQEKQVTVIKLITKQTIEENILKLQEIKRRLADQVVTEGVVSLSALSRKELLNILGV